MTTVVTDITIVTASPALIEYIEVYHVIMIPLNLSFEKRYKSLPESHSLVDVTVFRFSKNDFHFGSGINSYLHE